MATVYTEHDFSGIMLARISHRMARLSRRALDLQGICLYEWNNNVYC